MALPLAGTGFYLAPVTEFLPFRDINVQRGHSSLDCRRNETRRIDRHWDFVTPFSTPYGP